MDKLEKDLLSKADITAFREVIDELDLDESTSYLFKAQAILHKVLNDQEQRDATAEEESQDFSLSAKKVMYSDAMLKKAEHQKDVAADESVETDKDAHAAVGGGYSAHVENKRNILATLAKNGLFKISLFNCTSASTPILIPAANNAAAKIDQEDDIVLPSVVLSTDEEDENQFYFECLEM